MSEQDTGQKRTSEVLALATPSETRDGFINLAPFCDPTRVSLRVPFSHGDFTYAANGYVCVRVPRRSDIPESVDAPNAEHLFKSTALFFRAPGSLKIPEGPQVKCAYCSGRGKRHACPSCACKCGECDGLGSSMASVKTDQLSVGIGGASFAAEQLAPVCGLPQLQIPEVLTGEIMPFLFDGGQGVIIALRKKRSKHVDAETTHV